MGVAVDIFLWVATGIVIYVRVKLQKCEDTDLNVEDFLSLSSEVESCPNYIHMCSQVTNYTFAIINFRMALRWNNMKLAQNAVYKLSDMFYGRLHPFYQLIEFHCLAQMFTIHKDIKPLYEKYFSVSLCGNSSKRESWDFVLENINKHTQGLRVYLFFKVWKSMINSFSSYLHSSSTESKRLLMIRRICVNSKRLNIIKTRGFFLGFVCLFVSFCFLFRFVLIPYYKWFDKSILLFPKCLLDFPIAKNKSHI